MLYVKEANREDMEKEWAFVRDMPADENGMINEWPGVSREDFEEKALPVLTPYEVERVSYMDGCKIYLKGGGWVIARFSGTEPLLRVFGEMPDKKQAKYVCAGFKKMIDELDAEA